MSSDAVVTSDAADAADAVQPSTLLETLGLDAVGTGGPTGKGVGIAVIDSGLERGTDLNGGEHDKQYVFAAVRDRSRRTTTTATARMFRG